MTEKPTSAQLNRFAQRIRDRRYKLTPPEQHIAHIVALVESALALPGAFPELDCLRDEIERLKYDYPAEWPVRALQAIARAFAPRFKPSSKFMEGGWFRGGWDDVEKIADAIEREADRKAKDETDNLTPQAQAILFIQERLKTTGKLPPKTAVAQVLEYPSERFTTGKLSRRHTPRWKRN